MVDSTELGIVDYELYLLHTMVHASPGLIDEALRRVGADRAAMESAYRRVKDLNLALRPAFEDVCQLLGAPVYTRTYESQGRAIIGRGFELPLWEGLVFEVLGGEDGMLVDERFHRAPGLPTPEITGPADLFPWKVTLDEVRHRFGALEEGDLWLPFEEYSFTHISQADQGQEVAVIFSWGLLQSITISETLA